MPDNRPRLLALVLDLELNRDVRDTQAAPSRTRIPSSTSGWRRQLRHDGVATHRDQAAGYGPDVEIVHRSDAGDTEHPALHLGHGDVAGTPSSRMSVLSRMSRQAPTRISRARAMEMIGSARVQPVSR